MELGRFDCRKLDFDVYSLLLVIPSIPKMFESIIYEEISNKHLNPLKCIIMLKIINKSIERNRLNLFLW